MTDNRVDPVPPATHDTIEQALYKLRAGDHDADNQAYLIRQLARRVYRSGYDDGHRAGVNEHRNDTFHALDREPHPDDVVARLAQWLHRRETAEDTWNDPDTKRGTWLGIAEDALNYAHRRD